MSLRAIRSLGTTFPCSLAVLCTALSLAACSGGWEKGEIGGPITVSGTITDDTGQGVSGVTIRFGEAETISGSGGSYSLEIDQPRTRVALFLQAPSRVQTVSVVRPQEGVYHYHQDIELPSMGGMSMDAAQGGSMVLSIEGTAVTVQVPPDAWEGDPPGVQLLLAPYTLENGPGTLEAEGAAFDQALQSMGMFFIDAVDMSGDPVLLKPGKTISMKFAQRSLEALDDNGPMASWRMNGDGEWNSPTEVADPSEGSELSIGGGGSLSTTQVMRQGGPDFGFWNCDRTARTACVKGRIKSSKKQCGGQSVRASERGSGLSSTDTSGGDGYFCVRGGARRTMSLAIGKMSRSITMPSNPGGCSQPDTCADIGVITVEDTDCPGGCALDEIDTPTGCEKKDTPPPSTGGGGSTGGLWGTGACSGWATCGSKTNLQLRSCASVSGSSTKCWYETSDKKVWVIANCQNPQPTAQQVVSYCNSK